MMEINISHKPNPAQVLLHWDQGDVQGPEPGMQELRWWESCRSVTKLCPLCVRSLWLYELQRARLPRPSLSSGVCSNSGPLSWWCYLTISSLAAPFSFGLQSFPASESFFQWLGSSHGRVADSKVKLDTLSLSGTEKPMTHRLSISLLLPLSLPHPSLPTPLVCPPEFLLG